MHPPLSSSWHPRSIAMAISCAALSPSHAEPIEYCDGSYRYIDIEFMKMRTTKGCIGTRWPRQGEALGYTVSATPPDAPVEFIQEEYTVCFGPGPEFERIVSRGRLVPRYRVTGKPHEFGNYVRYQGGQTAACESVDYRPPPTARRPSPEVIEKTAPIVFGPAIEGTARILYSPANLKIERQSVQLYGVLQQPHVLENERLRNLARPWVDGRQASCREVDLGGFQCLIGGVDLSVLFASHGMVRPHATATARIRAAAEGPPMAPPQAEALPPPAAPPRKDARAARCQRMEAQLERYRAMIDRQPGLEGRLRQAERQYAQQCGDR